MLATAQLSAVLPADVETYCGDACFKGCMKPSGLLGPCAFSTPARPGLPPFFQAGPSNCCLAGLLRTMIRFSCWQKLHTLWASVSWVSRCTPSAQQQVRSKQAQRSSPLGHEPCMLTQQTRKPVQLTGVLQGMLATCGAQIPWTVCLHSCERGLVRWSRQHQQPPINVQEAAYVFLGLLVDSTSAAV